MRAFRFPSLVLAVGAPLFAQAPPAAPPSPVTSVSAVSASSSASSAIWDYDAYRKGYPEQVVGVRTTQSGRKDPEPARELAFITTEPARPNGKGPATTPGLLRDRLLGAWRELLGPSSRNVGPLDAKVLEEKEFPSYVRKKVEYVGDPGEPIRAWLFIPKGLMGAAPAMLCLHQTVRSGKDEAAGVILETNKPELAYGPLLAERGFVTLCPDAICFGERYQVGGDFYCHYGDAVRIYHGNAGRSLLSKMADDASRAVDYLSSLPEVDPKRIGSIGHSHGGYGTLFAMAYDERIAAGVVSCGWTGFRSDPTPQRWFRGTALMPRLGTFEGRMEETPVDFHHLFAAIAPRPIFVSTALKDGIFPNVGDTAWIEKDVRSVYAWWGRPDAFGWYAFEADHAFTPEARDRAWSFLDRYLKAD